MVDRSEYNRIYYQANKERIREQRRRTAQLEQAKRQNSARQRRWYDLHRRVKKLNQETIMV